VERLKIRKQMHATCELQYTQNTSEQFERQAASDGSEEISRAEGYRYGQNGISNL